MPEPQQRAVLSHCVISQTLGPFVSISFQKQQLWAIAAVAKVKRNTCTLFEKGQAWQLKQSWRASPSQRATPGRSYVLASTPSGLQALIVLNDTACVGPTAISARAAFKVSQCCSAKGISLYSLIISPSAVALHTANKSCLCSLVVFQ